MKKNQGFTLIELAVTFCLVATISILLFQIIAGVKELYIQGDVKTTLLNRQAIMTRKIYDELSSNVVTKVTSCGDACLRFTYDDGTSGDFMVDTQKQRITFHGYNIDLGTGSKLGTYAVSNTVFGPNGIIDFQIPITHKLTEGDYGIHIVYTYNTATTTVTL